MLPLQQTIQFSDYSELYDLIIPQDNLLRRINDLVDFSFIQKELMDKYCHDNGRMAESPVMMFKYLLLKTIYDISDVDVVERSRYDMSFKYFLGMTPENTDLINPSSLCKFRKLRLKDKDLLNLLIGKTVGIAIEKGIIKSRTIIVDATHTGSRSNPYSPIEILRLRSKQLRKSLYEADEAVKENLPSKNIDDELEHELDYTKALLDVVSSNPSLSEVPKIRERLNMLKEVLSDIEDHYVTSKDEEARVGHKSEDDSFFGYKTHIAMSDERIITAATVTSGEKGDGPQLEELVEQSRANGMVVDTVVGDTAYSGKDNIILSNNDENGFELVAWHKYDANDNQYLDTLGYDYDFSTLDARADKDVDPDAPICIGMDYNANINWIVAGQPRDRRLNVIKSFYVKFERKIPALVEDFCRYYAAHRNKTVVYYYDATALGSNYAVNDQDFHYNVVKEFERHGWRVESVYLGNPMRHDEKYLLINNAFAGKQRLMPFFNRSNNEDLILAVQSAGVSRGRNGFRKDKSGEKLAESEEDLLEHRTDGTDAFDTLYIGAEKFPFHDTFALSVSGVS